MIKKLQRRFIGISVVSLSVAMIVVVIIINLVNWFSVKRELETTINFISEGAQNVLPPEDMEHYKEGMFSKRVPSGANRHERNMVAQSNWYCAVYSADGTLIKVSGENGIDDDDSAIVTVANEALKSDKDSGRIGDYLYRLQVSGGRTLVYLLNCETRLNAMHRLMLISGLACAGAILITFIIVSIASRKAVEPTIRNMEQQKEFITNASHELKTPLTVISTNMELLDMEVPGNNWVAATKKQTAVMRRLVDELVYLSRMEEESAPLEMENVQLKSLIEEVAEPFEAMAEYAGREFTVHVEDGLHAACDRASVQRLFSTLLDNAMKYASGSGPVKIQAKTEGRYALIEVSNEVIKPLTNEQCEQLFNRFYRVDPSRNKDKQSGFGIGLAIARAIAEKHGGSIKAQMTEGNRLKFSCRLPIKQ